MIDFTVDTQIRRPPADVFAYATDPAKLATWQTNTVAAERLDDGPLRVGSRLREVHRAPGGRELPSVVEVSALEPDSVFGLRVVEGTPIHLDTTFEPADGGTRVRFRVHGRLTGAMRFAQPLVGPMLKRQFTSQLETLKRVLEAEPAVSR
jgi:uncharacterized protein YndB with AHSA1/START domain